MMMDCIYPGDSYLKLINSAETYLADVFEVICDSGSYSDALLATNRGLVVQKDIAAGGYVSSNQGELWLGSGRNDQVDVPKIVLGNSGVSRLEGGGPLYVPGVPSHSYFPAGENGQLFIYTPTSILYKHNGSTWVPQGPISNYAGYFDTLYIRKANAQDPAHLDVGDINVHGHLGVGDTITSDLNPDSGLDLGSYANPWASVMTSSLWVKSPNAKFGVTAGDQGYDVYLHPQNPANGGLGLGTRNYPFKWVDATTVFTNGINLLSGDTLYVGGSIAVLDDSHGFKCNTGTTTYFSMMRSGNHGYVNAHFGNLWLVATSDIHLNPAGNAVYCHKSFFPYGAGTYSQGDYNAYWNEVNAKSFPDRGCPIWIDAEDAKAILKTIKPHPTKKSANKLNGEEVP
jgi:hypothetical protein